MTEAAANALLRMRLANQHLSSAQLDDPAQLVAHLGAVQSQDYAAAKWAIGQRLRDATDASVEAAYADGTILRTHVLRPTWHFVVPQDIRWMLQLTGARIKAAMRNYARSMYLDETYFVRASSAIVRALEGGRSLTRTELGAALRDADVQVDDNFLLGQFLLRAEVDGIVISGPPRGRQHTWALLEERVPSVPALRRDEAVAELAWRYFNSHGPAVVQDCSWWSALPMADIKRGLEDNRHRLVSETIDDRTYWFAPESRNPAGAESTTVHLLPNFDEYTVAYRARELYFDPDLNRTGNPRYDVPFGDAIVACGRVVGRWKRTPRHGGAVESTWWIEPTPAMQRDLDYAASRYAAFVRNGA
ncbi:MAG: AlkZ family DNA glycosylase [Chloroflexi bacterium]|nr:AlkZ family DNA glycosylase [Chloroflexota bacterium]